MVASTGVMPDRDTHDERPIDDAVAEDGSALPRLPEAVSAAVGTAVETAVEAAGDVLHAAGNVVQAAGRRWRERPGQRVRRVRRLGRRPLANLYSAHADARRANPRELGVRSIPVDEISGTAVAGPDQRGGDFLPLRPFRSSNWAARWQRVRRAVEQLHVLPPIEVVRYGDGYWVTDGHNRVAAALYGGQIEIDANVTDLVPPGARSSERPGPIAPAILESRALRTAGSGAPSSGLVPLDEPTGRPPSGDSDASEEADS
jgi:hypothetical protein